MVQPLCRMGVHPNVLSLLGGILALAGALPAAMGHFSGAAVLFLLGSSIDALDGPVARASKTTSSFGALLDAVLDRIGEGALWIALIFYFAHHHMEWLAGTSAAALMFSFLTSYLRAWGEKLSLAMQDDWLTRPERVILLGATLLLGMPDAAAILVAVLSFLGFANRLYRIHRLLKRCTRT